MQFWGRRQKISTFIHNIIKTIECSVKSLNIQCFCQLSLRRQKADDEDWSDMSSLEGKGLKILTPNKLLTRLPNIISTNQTWKQFIQIKKRDNANTVSFVSA